MKVSFDFDGTLDREQVQKLALYLLTLDVDVWIHSARFKASDVRPNWNDDILQVASNIGIPIDNIVLTESYDKSIFLEDFVWHLDDSSSTIKSINENSKCKGIYYSQYRDTGWEKKCIKLIKKERS